MALTPGYFPANYFTHNYWQLGNQYWTTYGAPTGPADGSGVRRRRRRTPPSPRFDTDTLQLLYTYLDLKVNRYESKTI
jgi:hypothetical protein